MTPAEHPNPAPNESLPGYAARMYDALGIGDLYDDGAWVERAKAEALPAASALPDRPALPTSFLDRLRGWFR